MRARNGSVSLESNDRRVEAGGGDDDVAVTSAHMLCRRRCRQELGPGSAKYLIGQGRKEVNYGQHRGIVNNWVDAWYFRTAGTVRSGAPFRGCRAVLGALGDLGLGGVSGVGKMLQSSSRDRDIRRSVCLSVRYVCGERGGPSPNIR